MGTRSGVQPPASGAPAEALKRAFLLQQNGDYDRAIEGYGGIIVARPRSVEAKEALFRLGETHRLSRDYQRAVQTFEDFLRGYPQDDLAGPAVLQLATARGKAGNLKGAIEGYQRYISSQAPAEDYARLQMAQTYAEAGELAEAANEYARALDGELPSSTKQEVLEKTGDIYRELDMSRESLAWYQKALVTRQDGQRARLLFRIGEASEKLGDVAGATKAFTSLANNYPWSNFAPGALKRLQDTGVSVDLYRQGLIRYNQGQYAEAIKLFDRYLESNPAGDKAVPSRYYIGLAHQALGQQGKAVEKLSEVAGSQHPLASDALWEMGKLLEGIPRHNEAAQTYRQLWERFPSSERSEEALFRQGLVYYKAAQYGPALAAWEEHLDGRPGSKHRARSYLWASKALALLGRTEEARQQLERAAAYGLDDYYALRAGALLAPRAAPPKVERGRGEIEPWLASWTQASANLGPEVEQDPGFRRARELLAAGLRGEALGEFYRLLRRVGNRPAALYPLAVHFREKGLYSLSMAAAFRLLRLSPDPSLQRAPKALREFLYPQSFADLVAAESAKGSLDPLLLLALVRQESSFEPRAKSGADAMGLTQVIPSTAREIAKALGRDHFVLEDLYRPTVSMEFGAWYLANQLRHFGGNLFLAIAAYNGGAGNVQRWNRNNPRGDDDLFVEEIGLSETHLFVKTVYQNYELYKSTYGSGP